MLAKFQRRKKTEIAHFEDLKLWIVLAHSLGPGRIYARSSLFQGWLRNGEAPIVGWETTQLVIARIRILAEDIESEVLYTIRSITTERLSAKDGGEDSE